MSNDDFSRDSIFISVGKFRVGAVGRVAVLTVAVTIVLLVVMRSFGWL